MANEDHESPDKMPVGPPAGRETTAVAEGTSGLDGLLQ